MDEPIKKKKHYDRDLKRARDRFNSPKTRAALTEAIVAVPGATVFDVEHIVRKIGERKDLYKHVESFKDFRSQVIAWATRQAELTVRLRLMLPHIPAGSGTVGTMLFLRLPEFEGTDEQFSEWVTTTARREREGAEQLVAWIAEHRHAVRRGIRKILRHCLDLGVNDLWSNGAIRAGSDDEDEYAGESYPLDDLESQVWREVVYDTDAILSSTKPVSEQLYCRGYWAAFAWKKSRLRDKETLHEDIIIGLGGLERYSEDESNADVEVLLDEVANPDYVGMTNLPKPRVMLWDGQDAERRWADIDLARDLRRAGPFSADEAYGVFAAEMMPLAA